MVFAALVACVSLALALVHVHGEWVEISQHHYRPRKPARYSNTTSGEHGWTHTSDNWHQTTIEYDIDQWSRKPDEIDIPVERRPTSKNPEDNKRITIAPKLSSEDSGDIRTEVPVFVKDSPGPTRAIIEKVSNVGSVKRVQLPNTPVKSPITKISDRKQGPVDDTPVNEESDEFVIHANIFKNSDEELTSELPTNNRKQNYNKGIPNPNVDNTNLNHSYSLSNDTESKLNFSLNRRVTDTTETSVHSNITETIKNSNDKNVENVGNQNPDKVKNNFDRSNRKSLNDRNDHQVSEETNQDFKYPDDKTSAQNGQSNEFKVNTMENILKFMKVVTETISKNVRRGVNGKVKYLSELRDSLLQNIKYRIDACWPDDSPPGRQRARGRGRRSAEAARGHVEFPSSDSALMTISFLTFAVFLIKLVLQVIQVYKNKAMIMAPVMVATAGRRLARKQGIH